MERGSKTFNQLRSCITSSSTGPGPNAFRTAICALMQRFFAKANSVRAIEKAPFSLIPRRRSIGSKRANHLGGINQVSVIMCGTVSPKFISSLWRTSSNPGARKNCVTLLGSELLKSSRAAQHLRAVAQGATKVFPS